MIEKIKPEKIQLNTVVRPPVEGYAEPLSYAQLKEVQKVLGPRAEIIVPILEGKCPANRFGDSL